MVYKMFPYSFFKRCFLINFADTAWQGPTLVIVRSSNGFTFGGYASASWNRNGSISAAGSFVFWVENPQGRAPGCLDCAQPQNALCGGGNGPFFGGQTGCVGIRQGHTHYSQPTGAYPDTTGLGTALFTGSSHFSLDDYEVWAVA
jgi:hypothetical protein